jgi:hypothetical protein
MEHTAAPPGDSLGSLIEKLWISEAKVRTLEAKIHQLEAHIRSLQALVDSLRPRPSLQHPNARPSSIQNQFEQCALTFKPETRQYGQDRPPDRRKIPRATPSPRLSAQDRLEWSRRKNSSSSPASNQFWEVDSKGEETLLVSADKC